MNQSRNELYGLFCKRCGNGIVDDNHQKLHNLEKGDRINHIETDQVAEITKVIDNPENSEYPVNESGYIFEQVGLAEPEEGFIPHSELNEFELEEVNEK